MKFLLNKTLIFTVISEKVYGVFAFVFFFGNKRQQWENFASLSEDTVIQL